MLKLNGIFPPLPTSFDDGENLAVDKMQNNIRILSKYELSGFLVLGSNGELANLSEKEKLEVYNAAREVIPSNKIMLAGTGGQSTRETIRLTKYAADSGADAVLVLNPYYYKGLMTPEALTNHYFDVAEASTIPVIIYNMPACSGLDMNADTIIKISAHQNIIGMKDSGGNIVKMGDILHRAKPEFQILAGSAGFFLPALSMGAIGGILALANIAPSQCKSIYENYLTGDLEKARETQLKMIPVNAAITSKWGIPALKVALDHLGLYGGLARKPILPLKQEIKEQLLNLLNENDIHL
ncbi:dihydrodipicolinate synthase family protein [Bacteroidota bacterium]